MTTCSWTKLIFPSSYGHLDHQGTRSLSHLVSISEDCIHPPNLVSKDLGDPILLCHHHSCIPTQERLCPHNLLFSCQPLRIGVAYSEQTSCCLRTWCILCEWLLNRQNSRQSQILNSMRKSRPCPSQALTTVLQGEELRYESKMELSHGHIMLPPKLEVKF